MKESLAIGVPVIMAVLWWGWHKICVPQTVSYRGVTVLAYSRYNHQKHRNKKKARCNKKKRKEKKILKVGQRR